MSGIFISYRREDTADVAGRLADALSRHFGEAHVFRDIDAIDPGAEFAKVIAERIGTCDVLIALIGKDWLQAKDKEGRRRLDQPRDFVAAEIAEALAQRKLVIPALIEGVSMPIHESLPPQIAALADRHATPISDSRFDYDVGRLIVAIERVIKPHTLPEEQTRFTSQELQNRRDLLDDVKREIDDRLAQSLQNDVLIDVFKSKQPYQIQRPWSMEVKIGRQKSAPLPAGTHVVEVFEQDTIAGKLLILGALGAGKTISLLQLASELTARAECNLNVPMPVLVNLSSWKDDDQNLAGWLELELKSKYGVRKDVTLQWLEQRCLSPLLDGLDELEPTRQERCVQAINQFQQDYRVKHLVVCCRLAEYENLNTKLQLNGAICLQPLTHEQIRNYLVSIGRPDLWKSIEQDPELLEMASSPLLLSMMTLVFEEKSFQEWQQLSSTPERNRFLFDQYIERMLSREMKGDKYPAQKTVRWLAWLANRLKEQGQPEFLIEKLQPSWLQSRGEKWIYHVAVMLLVTVIFGLFVWLEESLMELVPKGKISIGDEVAAWVEGRLGVDRTRAGLSAAVIIVIIAGSVVGLKQTIQPIETLRWSALKARSGMVLGLRRWSIAGLEYGGCIGFVAGLIYSVFFVFNTGLAGELAAWSRGGQIAGVISGLTAGVFTLLMVRQGSSVIAGFRDQLEIASVDVLMSGLIVGLSVGLTFGLNEKLGWALLLPVLAGLNVAAIAGLGHGLKNRPAFRVIDALIVGLIGWLISGLITWFIGTLLFKAHSWKLNLWMSIWLYAWLGIAVTAALVAALITRSREKANSAEIVQGADTQVWKWLAGRWRQWVIVGVVAALSWTVILGSLMAASHTVIKPIALLFSFLGLGLITVLAFSLAGALGGVAAVAPSGALLGALLGAVRGGLTGPDIERRTVPNQGIRRSAVNVGIFALVGGLILGPIWWLANTLPFVLMTQLAPDALTWLRSVLSNVLFLSSVSALIPGAACIQHFALRFILWCRGAAPCNYARFLDYATKHMFLQRVGGRYRFMNDLLRDHFARMEAGSAKPIDQLEPRHPS